MSLNANEIVYWVLSQERLLPYASPGPVIPSLELLSKYAWNMELCEALYPLLHGFEVALRNRVHQALWQRTRLQRWMDHHRTPLAANESRQVRQAKNTLRRNNKRLTTGRIIAELTLGFWVNLFQGRYEQKLWHGKWLGTVFPYAPRSELGAHKIRARLNRIRYLRNRVFHHESVWHWSNLAQLHGEILETTSWLSNDWRRVLILHDRFPSVLAAGCQPIQRRIEALSG